MTYFSEYLRNKTNINEAKETLNLDLMYNGGEGNWQKDLQKDLKKYKIKYEYIGDASEWEGELTGDKKNILKFLDDIDYSQGESNEWLFDM